jgi:hypothetical protein
MTHFPSAQLFANQALFRSQYLPLVLYTISCYAGYLSFGKDAPSFIAIRPPLEGHSDIVMTIAQLGLIFGLTIAICVRINCNVETMQSILVKPSTESCATTAVTPVNSEMSSARKWLLNVISIVIPFVCSLLVTNNAISVISLISSLLCPYFIIIAPGKLKRPDEPPTGESVEN